MQSAHFLSMLETLQSRASTSAFFGSCSTLRDNFIRIPVGGPQHTLWACEGVSMSDVLFEPGPGSALLVKQGVGEPGRP